MLLRAACPAYYLDIYALSVNIDDTKMKSIVLGKASRIVNTQYIIVSWGRQRDIYKQPCPAVFQNFALILIAYMMFVC